MIKIITFTGAQGTGKTTMRKKLVEYLCKKEYKVISQYYGVVDSVARDAKNFGFTINEATNFITQYYIAHRFMVADLETRKIAEREKVDFIVLDRSVLDVIPYSNVSPSITTEQKGIIETRLMKHFKLFPSNLVFCEPLNFIEEDATRSIDKQFQDKVNAEFERIVDNVNMAVQSKPPMWLPQASIRHRFKLLIDSLGI